MSTISRRLSKHKQLLEVDATKVPHGIDELTFFSPSIPEEVKICISVLHESSQADFRIALKSVFEYLVYDKLEDNNSNAFLAEDVDNSIIEAGLYKILHLIIRKKIKMSKLSEDLHKMNMPSYAIDDIIRLFTVHRANIENTIKMKSIGFPRLLRLQWRINVVISSGTLSNVMKPTVIFKVKFNCLYVKPNLI